MTKPRNWSVRGVTLACILIAANGFATPQWTDVEALRLMPLEALIDEIKQDASSASDAYLEAAEYALRRAREESSPDMIALGCAYLARVHYRRGAIDTALSIVDDCIKEAITGVSATNSVFLRYMLSSLLIANRQPELARKSFETILAEDLSKVDPSILRQVRANYAVALKHDGEPLESLLVLTAVLDDALEYGEAPEQTLIGNNLVVNLEQLRLYEDARDWIVRLRPAMERIPDSFQVQSLRLHEIQLEGIVGDRAKAIPAMRAYIAAMEGGAPVMIGSAHAYLSDMLHEEGRYDEALAAATEADKLLSANPVETVDARLRLARAELALGNFDSAQGLLDEVSALDVKVESSLVKLESLKLQLGLARSGQQELLSNYQELDAARARQETTRLSQRSGYYNARREAARKATELEGLQRRQALLEAQNIASEARAESAKQSRNLTLVSAASIVVLAALLGYLLSRRRFDRRFRNEQAALTEELESEVRVQSEALARRAHNEALGQLTGNVAHDFNNLLQVMSIANERLATESISDASHRLLQGSNEALSSARGIIGRLLAYARQQELDEQPISIPDFLDDARPLLEAALGTSVALEVVSFLPPSVGIKADTAQLTSALINLLKNAAEAMPGSGTVRLSFELLEVREDDTGADHDLDVGRYIQLSVCDDGVGMSEDQVRRAIEPFFSTRTDVSGTGLGLSSVYGFARQSGGDLQITSVLGQGTTVSLYFPVVPVSLVSRNEPEAVEVEHSELGALVVEDNAVLGEALVAMLEFMGISPHLVTSAEAAMAELTAHPDQVDFVISDIRMPGQYDGLMLADWVETNFPALPILLMSGFSDSERIERPVLRKPFTQAELEAALARISRGDRPIAGETLNDGRGERI